MAQKTEETGNGVVCKVEGDNLIVSVPLEKKLAVSRGGKHIMVATTHGQIETGIEHKGKPVIVQVNAFTNLE